MAAIPPGADLSKIPLAPNPNRDPPNFVNPPNQAVVVLAVGVPLVAISSCFVSLRIFTNYRVAHKLGLDDYLCIFAQVMITVYLGCAISFRNTSRHEYDIPLSSINESYAKRSFVMNFIVGPTLWSSKAVMLTLYVRLFGPKKWLRYVCYATLSISFLFYWAQSILTGVFCAPRHGGPWGFDVLQNCAHTAVMAPIQGAVGVAADLLILVLPLPIIYGLHLPKLKKIGLSIVFLMGIFAIATSVVSLYFRIILYLATDKFWNNANIWACVCAECYVTIIVSCAPATSAFWANTLIKSSFYSRFRSSFLFSWSTRWASTKNSGPSDLQGQSPYPGSSSQLVRDNNNYYELSDRSNNRNPRTTVFTSRQQRSIGQPGMITKSTSIKQSEERSY